MLINLVLSISRLYYANIILIVSKKNKINKKSVKDKKLLLINPEIVYSKIYFARFEPFIPEKIEPP